MRTPYVDRALGGRPDTRGSRAVEPPAPGLLGRIVVEHPLTNDDVFDAKRIPAVPYTAKTDTTGATRQGEPGDCSSTGGTVWYRYRATGNVALIADTAGTASPASLGVFTGSPGRLRLVGCASGAGAQVAVPTIMGTTYFFQVARTDGDGRLVFNLTEQTTTRASVTSANAEGLTYSVYPAISSDGRYVAFASDAALDPNYPDVGCVDRRAHSFICPMNLYLRDRVMHKTTLVSLAESGEPANDPALGREVAAISDDGRYVAFSAARDASLPPALKNNVVHQVFVRDLLLEKTTMVSVASDGTRGNGHSGQAHMSADGRYIAFYSTSSNLVPADTNGVHDVFVHDRRARRTIRVSVSSKERQANNDTCTSTLEGSDLSSISKTGRYVAFRSCASNLVPGDTNKLEDVFLRDLKEGRTIRINVSSAERQADGDSVRQPGIQTTISADGRFVAFMSSATNLVPRDTNGGDDVFVRDVRRGLTERVSVSSSGEQAEPAERPSTSEGLPYAWYGFSMTPDGRYITFSSIATNLVRGDTNGLRDVFMHDRVSGVTTRVSLTHSGQEANGDSESLVMSADGRFVAWWSDASNLVPADTNQAADVFVREIPRPGRRLTGWY